MAHGKKNSLVHRPGTGLAGQQRRTSPVIARMTRDILARAEPHGLSQARFRIGEHLLREPDYRQVLSWAEALDMAPQAVLEQLAASRVEPEDWGHWEPIALALEDGAIVSLAWDFERLPLIPESWQDGLLIRTLGLQGRWPDAATALRPHLPRLEILVCEELGLESLDLSRVSGLTWLDCDGNQLTELDLTPVPGLTELDCGWSGLTQLDLTPVPGLTELDCSGNGLTQLDLTPVPGLTALVCWNNRLTELDLTPVPGLISLHCDEDVRILNAPPGLNNRVRQDDIPF